MTLGTDAAPRSSPDVGFEEDDVEVRERPKADPLECVECVVAADPDVVAAPGLDPSECETDEALGEGDRALTFVSNENTLMAIPKACRGDSGYLKSSTNRDAEFFPNCRTASEDEDEDLAVTTV